LDLALARIRNNIGQLRGPIQRSGHEGLWRKIGGRVKVAHLQYYLGAALSVALVGIAVNALLLQRERHPAPLFGSTAPKPTPAPAPAPAPPPSPTHVSAEAEVPPAQSPAALPPERPSVAAAGSASASDPIGDLLAGETHSDGSRLVLAAQTALAKLGYAVKADGKEGAATQQALKEFEHAHGLPPATEINERLVKQLTQAARGAGR
jgi:Putative peptidoglycan binding domain